MPLNALLQERGHESIGAGNALAVQNFVENIAMLLLVGGYSLAVTAGMSVVASTMGFGFMILLAIGTLTIFKLRHA